MHDTKSFSDIWGEKDQYFFLRCTALFKANPDVSGIGIIAAFYAQGCVNQLLSFAAWVFQYLVPRKGISYCLERTLNTVIPTTTAVGFSMLIAAFTQRGEITHYHLFICITLANAVSGSAPYGLVGFFSRDSRQRLMALYFSIYQLTYVATIFQAIKRLRVWKDEPGKCFNTGIGSAYGLHGLFERDNLVLWFQYNLGYTLFRQVVIPIAFLKGWPSVCAPKTRKARGSLSFLFIQAPRLLSFVWSIYWVHMITMENHHLIEGDENTWGFGQVSTFVALIGSLYGITISFRSAQTALKREHYLRL